MPPLAGPLPTREMISPLESLAALVSLKPFNSADFHGIKYGAT